MAARNFLPRFIAFELQIFNDFLGIRLKYAVHLGKKFLAAIFSAIIYCQAMEDKKLNFLQEMLVEYHKSITFVL